MEALPPILIGAAVAAVVAFGIRRVLLRRRREEDPAMLAARRTASDLTFVVVGLAVMVLSLVAAQRLLSIEPPPEGERYEAGVGFSPDIEARPGRGFVVGLAARFRNCDEPAEVTIAITGTAEYFEDNEARLRKRAGFWIAVPGEIGDVALGYGNGYEDALKPSLALMGNWLPDDTVQRGSSRMTPRKITGIRGTVDGWSSHLASLVLTFDADWLADRGLGTCYLALPPLVGEYSVLGAQDVRGRSAESAENLYSRFPQAQPLTNARGTLFVPDDPSLFVRNGIAVVRAGGNEILDIEPSTNTNSAGVPALACSKPPLEIGELGSRGSDLVRGPADRAAHAIRGAAYSDQVGDRDCSALVTLAEAGAGDRRDLVLLLVGAVFSLGAALVLEIALDAHRRRLGPAA